MVNGNQQGRKMRSMVFLAATIAAFSAAAEFRVDKSAMSDKYWQVWNDAEQAKIDAEIEANR